MCVGCRAMKNKRSLIRIVRTPEDDIKIDATGKMSGRGSYICPNRECLKAAVRSRGLEKSLKTKISAEIIEELEKNLNAGFENE